MVCKIEIDDLLTISNADDPKQLLHLEISRFYCKLFESATLQCRDYLEEIMRWSDGNVENYDYVSNNLMHVTYARRRSYGLDH